MTPPPAPPPAGVPELVLQAVGLVVAVWAAMLLALMGAFLTPLRMGGVLVPVSILIAVVGNLAVVWFVQVATGRRGLALVPGLAWGAVTVLAGGRTTEGDLLISNWVGPISLLAGAATLALALFFRRS